MKRLLTDLKVHHILQENMYKFMQNVSEESRQKAFIKIKEMADKGYPEAIFDHAILIKDGKCTNKDPEKAFKLIKELAKTQYPKAEYETGELYELGTGTVRNVKEAVKWYFLSLEHGYDYARTRLGKIYDAVFDDKIGESTDTKNIRAIFRKYRDLMYSVAENIFETTSYPYYGLLWMQRAAANNCREAVMFMKHCSEEDIRQYERKITMEEFELAVRGGLGKRGFRNVNTGLRDKITGIIRGQYYYVEKWYDENEGIQTMEDIIENAVSTVKFWY